MKSIIFITTTLIAWANSLVQEDLMPSMLQDCYSNRNANNNKLEAQTNCLEKYLSYLFGNTTYHVLDQNAVDWIDSLGQRIHKRLKRQTYGYKRYNPYQRLDTRRVRKEIRTLTDRERQDFFDAVNALKNDKSQLPNKYDAMALLHQTGALASAHGGPNFPSWHRYYLTLFEEALRTKKRTVTLPYWDSTLDFRMSDPAESVLWSEIFLGNGKGVVFKGPFASWRTPAENTLLRRDIPGPESSLIDPDKIINVFRKHYHREILSPTAASDLDNLESHHDGVHRWVGGRDGHMGGLETSPQDPVFFLHHCYIDYLWEQFRERQAMYGIDSESDYPMTDDPNHQPNRIMDNLTPPKSNIEGYSNSFTRNIYRYAPAPTCRNGCGGGYNGFLFCNPLTNQCESRSKRQFMEMNGFSNVNSPYISQTGRAGDDVGPMSLTVPSSQNVFLEATNTGLSSSNAAPSLSRKFPKKLIDPRTAITRKRRSVTENHSKQDHSTLNGNKLAFMPITIINVHDNQRHILKINDYETKPKTFNISLQTIGFSYNGQHTDFISIDERTSFSEYTASVVFEKPFLGETRLYVRVYDSFGGLCSPHCLVYGTRSYKECSGVLKITPDLPLMYGDTETDMVGQKAFMNFYCYN